MSITNARTSLTLSELESLSETIYSSCYGFSVLEICVDVYLSQVCAKLKMLGFEIDRTCTTWRRDGSELTAEIGLGNPTVGYWKLDNARLVVKLNSETNDGSVGFSAELLKLTFSGYRKQKAWSNETIFEW